MLPEAMLNAFLWVYPATQEISPITASKRIGRLLKFKGFRCVDLAFRRDKIIRTRSDLP